MWKERTKIKGKLVTDAPAGSYRLYRMTNSKNNKEYIGITANDLQVRLRGHRRQAKKGTRSPLYNAMRHHGIKNFCIELLRDDASDFIELQDQEVEEIERRQTMINGYNTAAGGALVPLRVSRLAGKHFLPRVQPLRFMELTLPFLICA
jgi:group I intron endonuclease